MPIKNVLNDMYARDVSRETRAAFMEATVKEANGASNIIKKQMEAVTETDNSFKTIVGSMEGLSSQISDVMNSLKVVLKSKENTLETMENISAVAEEAASASEEVSASAHEQITNSEVLADLAVGLHDMSKKLSEIISKFKVEQHQD